MVWLSLDISVCRTGLDAGNWWNLTDLTRKSFYDGIEGSKATMVLFIPTGVNYRTDRFPVVTFTIMGLNVAIFLVTLGYVLSQGETAQLWIYENLWLIPSSASWHQYFTAMFVHGDFSICSGT
jgi:membrane associated rhomboid family serine protease